jgi:CRP-like cAMP-binding protein
MGTGDLPGRTKRRSDQGHRSATTPAPAPSGAVCFGAIASSGKGSIVALAEVPQWFDGGARTHDASADITSTLLHLPLRHLTRILADDPGRWQQMGRLLVRKLRIALSLLEDMALEPPGSGWRDALSICSRVMYGQLKTAPSCCVRVSQECLGMMLSLSRQTNRAQLDDSGRRVAIVVGGEEHPRGSCKGHRRCTGRPDASLSRISMVDRRIPQFLVSTPSPF